MLWYQSFAQFVNSPINGKVVTGLPFMDILYDGRLIYHKVKIHEQGRLDLIAYQWFKDPTMKYLIAAYNGIKDPIEEVVVGLDLAIPLDGINKAKDIKAWTYKGVVGS